MSDESFDAAFERHWNAMPESKLELLGGKLIISTIAGSRWIAREILRDYGPLMMLPMAPPSLWWQALQAAYAPQPLPASVPAWEAWSDRLEYEPSVAPAGPRDTRDHHRLFDLLKWGLWHLAESTGLGETLGRDFVIRLGENGPTPDVVFMDRTCLERLRDRYLDGPPTLAIEIVSPGSADQDRVIKRRLYEEARIPEFWLVDPEVPRMTFLRLGEDRRCQSLVVEPAEITRLVETGEERLYHSTAVPGLVLSLQKLWTMEGHDWKERWPPFLPIAREVNATARRPKGGGGIQWDEVPFRPRVDLGPVPIRFDEYISWCGRAKFERSGAGIEIGGSEGTRRVAGMLLMTFGLAEIVRLAHPREWVVCLTPERHEAIVQPHTERFMRQARYRRHDDPREAYTTGKIAELPDLWGYGETREACEADLTQQVRDWVLLRIARREPLPAIE
jgi:Uma2 family endonuclease